MNVFHRHVWLMRHLGVGGGKIWRFSIVQVVIWLNALSLSPTLVGDKPLAIRCMVLAFCLVSTGSSFKLIQLRRFAKHLNLLLEELGGQGKVTPMILFVGKISKVYVSILLGMLCAWLAFPWLRGEPVLPLDFWAPFPLEGFIPFVSFYSFASLGLVAVAYTQEAVDTLVLLVAAFICRRLDHIGEMMEEVGVRDFERTHCKGLDNREVLRASLSEHIQAIRLIRVFDTLLNDIFLVQVLQTTIVSTICFFSASKMKDLNEVPKFFVIVSVTYLQFYIYCWLGGKISEHANLLHRRIYQNCWYECDLKIKRDVQIFETFTKNHFKLKGGYMFTIQLETFLRMIRESFSAFMVLRAVAK